jgi:anti-sigma factor RsiW
VSDARDYLDPDMLSGYLDGELDAGERAAVEARLAESPEWRDELEEVRAARAAVRSLAVHEAPPGFWDAVLATVGADADSAAADGAPTAPVVQLDDRRRRRFRWVAGAAAAVAVVVVAVVIVPHRAAVSPNVTAVIVQHGAQSSDSGDPISTLTPVGPLAGFHR